MFGRWESFEEFLAFNRHVECLLLATGMILWEDGDNFRFLMADGRRPVERGLCGTAPMPSSRSSLERGLSLSTRPVGDGNTRPLLSASSRASSRMATARPDSGTRCSSFAFMRDGGTVQVAAASSTSAHCAPRTSPERQAVSTRNSKASAVARWARDARTRASASPTCACGSAFWCWRRTLFFGSTAEWSLPPHDRRDRYDLPRCTSAWRYRQPGSRLRIRPAASNVPDALDESRSVRRHRGDVRSAQRRHPRLRGRRTTRS